MKWNLVVSVAVFISCSVILICGGCEEEYAFPQTSSLGTTLPSPADELTMFRTQLSIGQAEPQIIFEKVVHDFGEIGSGANNYCEFRFGNAGKGILEIQQVTKACSCTPFELTKKQYAPGESGILKVGFHPGTTPGLTENQLYVTSNDRTAPKVTLTVKARIVTKVECEPKQLVLLLTKENSQSPTITLTSTDNQPFSIKNFISTANCITADFDPSATATRYVIQPKMDIKKLQQGLEGLIAISLNHPQCSEITIPFASPPKFQVNPATVTIFDAEARRPIIKTIWIVNNYGEDFDVQSVSSKNNSIKVLSKQKVHNGYELEIQITPPDAGSNRTMFTDVLDVNIKGGEKVQTSCSGFYQGRTLPSSTYSSSRTSTPARKSPFSQTATETEEECRTCKPHLITDWTKKN